MSKTDLKPATVSVRINPDIKKRAIERLAKSGLSLSDYTRIAITSVANDGLPKYFGIPNADVLDAVGEMIDDATGKKRMPEAHSLKELKERLNDDD
ncbi:type II toxin-antitoxin system RelB/DinJ family antitoxin [Lentilactobacillus kisonensis]|uniref:Addiction module antitoxin, RelB/DinJ family n=2 Tax=Lentilactobacillus kisonensis TaxID=481722 RepID=H1LI00_9LACO|nr:type II toxin-antitoxin system RelB/DinJ family antitoxin [Lentilactobacillus kisonensis]EHO50035.1 addiction module antitoxin, RelB/DinJ family [Lentilactobacillus kisonensis F0435]KRL22195.1 addiction module antitoxin, RelB DinJ family [Lentilactobacillus kisonensis DSM 19906 = JCM 15041]